VRVDFPQDRIYAQAAGVLAVLVSVGLGVLFAGTGGAVAGVVVGLGLAVGFAWFQGRRSTRRWATLARPFPEAWRRFLESSYDHYDRLPEGLRARFEDDVRILIAEKRITGVQVPVTDELRLLVAASAVTLSLGWPDYEWDQLTEVLLYPDDFDRDFRFGGHEYVGQTHPWGTVILSVPALEESFDDPDDGYHVGLHEFAHLLDVDQTHFDGIPVGLNAAHSREWVALMEKEMERLRKGKSVLDSYGAESPVEFLAVSVEAFFQIPQQVRKRHREVYMILSAYFGQDPAAWDDERGLLP
jgi:Mlc titration factor MtfA (ptsG expression regulator)